MHVQATAWRAGVTALDVTRCEDLAFGERRCGAGSCIAHLVELGPLAMVAAEQADPSHVPWCHPHTGVEVVTVMLAGAFVHADAGGSCVVGSDDVSLLAAGGGTMHEEHVHDSARAVTVWLRAPIMRGGGFMHRTLPRIRRLDRLVPVACSRDPQALRLSADATVATGVCTIGATVTVASQRGCLYLLSTIGRISVDGVVVEPGDRVIVRGRAPVRVRALQSTEIVAIDAAA